MTPPTGWANIPTAALTLDDAPLAALAAILCTPPNTDGARWVTITRIAELCGTKRDTAAVAVKKLEAAGWVTPAGQDWHRTGWRVKPHSGPTVPTPAGHITQAGKHLRTLAAAKSFDGDSGCYPSRAAIAERLGHPNPGSVQAARRVSYHLAACREAGLVAWRLHRRGLATSAVYTFPGWDTGNTKAAPAGGAKATRGPKTATATRNPTATPETPTRAPKTARNPKPPADPVLQHMVQLTEDRIRPHLAAAGVPFDEADRAAIVAMMGRGETSRSITRAVFYAAGSDYWRTAARPSRLASKPAIFEQAKRDTGALSMEMRGSWNPPPGVSPMDAWDAEADGWEPRFGG